jgi:hypothetical protein
LPLEVQPAAGVEKCFPINARKGWYGSALTVREIWMLAFMDQITDKPE